MNFKGFCEGASALGVFTRLGLASFGGPIAHLGYFREEFVARRKWIGGADYADLVALFQFLRRPAPPPPPPPAPRSVSQSACAARAISAGSRPGPGSRFPPPSR